MRRTVYHGSNQIIRVPKFGVGGAFNDFGIGFYCTDSRQCAFQWATRDRRNGFVNTYTIDDTGLSTLDLGAPRYCILHWLSILLRYREFDTLTPKSYQAGDYIRSFFTVDLQNYDCIIGWRADNMHFAFAQDFLNGEISYRELEDLVRSSGLGRQIVFRSNRAFDRILFNGYESVKGSEVFPSMVSSEYRVINDYCTQVLSKPNRPGLYISDIMDENIREYDPRLTQ